MFQYLFWLCAYVDTAANLINIPEVESPQQEYRACAKRIAGPF